MDVKYAYMRIGPFFLLTFGTLFHNEKQKVCWGTPTFLIFDIAKCILTWCFDDRLLVDYTFRQV